MKKILGIYLLQSFILNVGFSQSIEFVDPIKTYEYGYSDRINLMPGTLVLLGEDNYVKYGILKEIHRFSVNGGYENLALDSTVHFHDNGKLFQGKLAEDVTIKIADYGQLVFAQGHKISFYKNEQVAEGVLLEETNFSINEEKQITVKAGYIAYFSKDGKLLKGSLALNTSFSCRGKYFAEFLKDTEIYFDPEGFVIQGVLARDTRFSEELELEKETQVRFGKDGDVVAVEIE